MHDAESAIVHIAMVLHPEAFTGGDAETP